MPSITETGLKAISDVRVFVYQMRHRLPVKAENFNHVLAAERSTITRGVSSPRCVAAYWRFTQNRLVHAVWNPNRR